MVEGLGSEEGKREKFGIDNEDETQSEENTEEEIREAESKEEDSKEEESKEGESKEGKREYEEHEGKHLDNNSHIYRYGKIRRR